MLASGLRGECDLVNSMPNLLDIKSSTDRFVVEDDIYSDFAPACLRSVDRESKRFSWFSSSCTLLVRNLKKTVLKSIIFNIKSDKIQTMNSSLN